MYIFKLSNFMLGLVLASLFLTVISCGGGGGGGGSSSSSKTNIFHSGNTKNSDSSGSSGRGSSDSSTNSQVSQKVVKDIANFADLQKIGTNYDYPLNGNYKLTGDITITDIRFPGLAYGNDYNNKPIFFSGQFDGNSQTITISAIDLTKFRGLFEKMDGATVNNLTISVGTNLILTNRADQEFGVLAGYANNTTIDNVKIIKVNDLIVLSASEKDRVGVLVGNINLNSRINNCSADLAALGKNYVGGLVGYFYGGGITNSYAMGKVSGNIYVGGLVGYSRADIINSYALGAVYGNIQVGGLVGQLYSGSIVNNYSTGAVYGNTQIGGLVGYSNGAIAYNYATGSASGDDSVGGLAGTAEGDITYNYASGKISGNSNIGGLIGIYSGKNKKINNNLIFSAVQDATNSGGFIGNIPSYVVFDATANHFYNNLIANKAVGLDRRKTPANAASKIADLTVLKTKIKTLFGNSDIWDIADDSKYPILKNVVNANMQSKVDLQATPPMWRQ